MGSTVAMITDGQSNLQKITELYSILLILLVSPVVRNIYCCDHTRSNSV